MDGINIAIEKGDSFLWARVPASAVYAYMDQFVEAGLRAYWPDGVGDPSPAQNHPTIWLRGERYRKGDKRRLDNWIVRYQNHSSQAYSVKKTGLVTFEFYEEDPKAAVEAIMNYLHAPAVTTPVSKITTTTIEVVTEDPKGHQADEDSGSSEPKGSLKIDERSSAERAADQAATAQINDSTLRDANTDVKAVTAVIPAPPCLPTEWKPELALKTLTSRIMYIREGSLKRAWEQKDMAMINHFSTEILELEWDQAQLCQQYGLNIEENIPMDTANKTGMTPQGEKRPTTVDITPSTSTGKKDATLPKLHPIYTVPDPTPSPPKPKETPKVTEDTTTREGQVAIQPTPVAPRRKKVSKTLTLSEESNGESDGEDGQHSENEPGVDDNQETRQSDRDENIAETGDGRRMPKEKEHHEDDQRSRTSDESDGERSESHKSGESDDSDTQSISHEQEEEESTKGTPLKQRLRATPLKITSGATVIRRSDGTMDVTDQVMQTPADILTQDAQRLLKKGFTVEDRLEHFEQYTKWGLAIMSLYSAITYNPAGNNPKWEESPQICSCIEDRRRIQVPYVRKLKSIQYLKRNGKDIEIRPGYSNDNLFNNKKDLIEYAERADIIIAQHTLAWELTPIGKSLFKAMRNPNEAEAILKDNKNFPMTFNSKNWMVMGIYTSDNGREQMIDLDPTKRVVTLGNEEAISNFYAGITTNYAVSPIVFMTLPETDERGAKEGEEKLDTLGAMGPGNKRHMTVGGVIKYLEMNGYYLTHKDESARASITVYYIDLETTSMKRPEERVLGWVIVNTKTGRKFTKWTLLVELILSENKDAVHTAIGILLGTTVIVKDNNWMRLCRVMSRNIKQKCFVWDGERRQVVRQEKTKERYSRNSKERHPRLWLSLMDAWAKMIYLWIFKTPMAIESITNKEVYLLDIIAIDQIYTKSQIWKTPETNRWVYGLRDTDNQIAYDVADMSVSFNDPDLEREYKDMVARIMRILFATDFAEISKEGAAKYFKLHPPSNKGDEAPRDFPKLRKLLAKINSVPRTHTKEHMKYDWLPIISNKGQEEPGSDEEVQVIQDKGPGTSGEKKKEKATAHKRGKSLKRGRESDDGKYDPLNPTEDEEEEPKDGPLKGKEPSTDLDFKEMLVYLHKEIQKVGQKVAAMEERLPPKKARK